MALDNLSLQRRTIRMGFNTDIRVALACGFDGTLLREGTIIDVAPNGMINVAMDGGQGGGRYASFERATILTEEDEASDAAIDRWHHGRDIFKRGDKRPYNPEMASGWDDAMSAAGVRLVEVERPEGYYHAPVGSMD